MIQIFEIIQESSNGWWSDNKDTIAGVGVIISFFAALASLWAININRKTLKEIETQRKQSFLPYLIFGNTTFNLVEVEIEKNFNFPLSYMERQQNGQTIKKDGISYFYLYLYNCGLGPAKDVKITFEYEHELFKKTVRQKFKEVKKINTFKYLELSIYKIEDREYFEFNNSGYKEGYTYPNEENLFKKNTHVYPGNFNDSFVLVAIPMSFWVLFRFANYFDKIKYNNEKLNSVKIQTYKLFAKVTYHDVAGLSHEKNYCLDFKSMFYTSENIVNTVEVMEN